MVAIALRRIDTSSENGKYLTCMVIASIPPVTLLIELMGLDYLHYAADVSSSTNVIDMYK